MGPSVDSFAPFRHIDPSDNGFRCIYYLVDKGRSCQLTIDKGLRNVTYFIKQRILNESSHEERSTLLEKFAENCGCKRFHRSKLTGTPLARELCQRWERELGNPPAAPVRPGEDSPRTPSINTPTSSGGYHVGRPNAIAAAPIANSRYWLRSNAPVYGPTVSLPGTEEETLTSEFEPMKRTTQTLVSVLLKPLSAVRDWEFGDVYAFSRESSPGMLKIGYSKATEKRLVDWNRTCLYSPVLQYRVRDVPHMPRVETLVHYELLSHWRRELNCKHNPNCPRQHREWFECSVETAKDSMNNFSEWMKAAKPYDANGTLKPQWRNLIRTMVEDGRKVTSQSLLAALQKPQQKIDAPLPAQIDEPTSPSTPVAPQKSTPTSAPGLVASTSKGKGLDKAAVLRDILSLPTDQFIALIASVRQARLV